MPKKFTALFSLDIKTQVIVNKKNSQILATNFSNSKKHDFKLFKESKLKVNKNTKVLVDTGYLEIKDIISNLELPKKRSKNHKLTKKKIKNREISSKRVLVENVIGSVKRFELRFSLIVGIFKF